MTLERNKEFIGFYKMCFNAFPMIKLDAYLCELSFKLKN